MIKINISKSKPKTVLSLQDALNKSKDTDKMLTISSASSAISPLQKALNTKKPDWVDEKLSLPIPQVTTEKYKLIANASDTLSIKTIEQFEIRMQTVVNSMHNSELAAAMERVSEYTKEHKELRPFIRAQDVQIFVEGARNSYAAVTKVKEKNRKTKSNSSKLNDMIANELSDLIIDL